MQSTKKLPLLAKPDPYLKAPYSNLLQVSKAPILVVKLCKESFLGVVPSWTFP